MFPGEHFVADVTLPVLWQADSFVHVILQPGEDEEGLAAGSAEESLGLMSPHVSLQPGQVGADDTALVAGEICVKLNMMNLKVVLIQQSSLLKTSFANTAEVCLVRYVFRLESNLLDEKLRTVVIL